MITREGYWCQIVFWGILGRVIADPDNPRQFELRQWVGRPFRPETFDPELATRETRFRG
jgi:hypothetical protein